MVCDRCIMAVKDIFISLGITISSIKLGEVETAKELNSDQMKRLSDRLTAIGFELLDDKRSKLIEQIKTIIVEIVYNRITIKTKLSNYISDKLHLDYKYVSALFSESEGITIEKYFITQKIERAKELLEYDELNLNEIAFELNYSSAAHLSTQFKKITGVTPSQFKDSAIKNRIPIDKL